ncbi:MAG: hypothetical protein A2Y00_08205 [Omnitrophica WOR_2 bacterium GWF2_43_52]|nr:MAG: hypothetical protein A2Y01_00335 [Omnitrophica WOR_2 bacterium GWC2_44_8]OGX21417.1 MAG: hypothetical protein A2Y00_08205 [Omnitrophica WOR_2 bacterium GWF2_43_52]HAH21955.1 hypothetical protein [Candidatus Omnitrophota bacterium]HBG62632.1 hypothetical protein [Candidatus Omnitrophota bacterium]
MVIEKKQGQRRKMNKKRYIGLFMCFIGLIIMAAIVFAEPIPENKFCFGIEYLMPQPGGFNDIINVYSEIGAVWSKFNGPGTGWNDIEPTPPVKGRHTYSWDKVDEIVLTAQRAGFKRLIVVLKSNSRWGVGNIKPSGPLERLSASRGTVSALPDSEQNLKHYQDYVFNFVERYDGDGRGDLPGLLYPILDYEIETEAQHGVYWHGTADDYVILLKTAYEAVKKAGPRARVILSGFAFFDIFDEGSRNEEEIARLIDELSSRYPRGDIRHKFGEKFRAQLDFNARILKEKDYFDAVEFHLLSYYKSIPGIVAWIRGQMAKNGYEKPIWMGDAGAVIVPCSDKRGFLSSRSTYTIFSKAPYENGDALFEILRAVQDKHGLRYQEVRSWFEAEQARILVKSLVLAMGEGIEGGNWWTWKDVPQLLKSNGTGRSWALCGLIDDDNQSKRPVFHSYKLLIQKLGAFSSVEKLVIRPDINAYKFIVKGKPVYVAWHDSGIAQSPGQSKSIRVGLPLIIGKETALLTPIITSRSQTVFQEDMNISRDIVLTETPVFIE